MVETQSGKMVSHSHNLPPVIPIGTDANSLNLTPKAFATMQEQIKTLTQGLQEALQANENLRKQISESSIPNPEGSQ